MGVAAPITTAYAIDAVSNKLSQVGTTNRTYDSVGNTTLVGTDSSVYSARNRLVQINKNGVLANYGYNAFGERVIKTVSGSSKQFVYDEDLHLLGEYDVTGSLASEYIWLGDVPVAVLKPSGSAQGGQVAGSAKVYYIQPDHLDTPRVIVNAANQAVWRWDSAPFGDTVANEQPTASLASFQFDLRFPGQQFDATTLLTYNRFRDYETATSRCSRPNSNRTVSQIINHTKWQISERVYQVASYRQRYLPIVVVATFFKAEHDNTGKGGGPCRCGRVGDVGLALSALVRYTIVI